MPNARLYETIAGRIAADIADGAWEIGGRLPSERELAARYGVSRPTLREAVIALELDGLVEVRMGSGVYLRAREPGVGAGGEAGIGPFELLEARAAVESQTAALAAARIAPEEIARLEALLAEMSVENDRDVDRSEDADRRFHLTIAQASRNSALAALVEQLWDARNRSPQARRLFDRVRAAGVTPRIDEHAAILDALRAGDAADAAAAMRSHLDRVMDAVFTASESDAISEARARIDAQRQLYRHGADAKTPGRERPGVP